MMRIIIKKNSKRNACKVTGEKFNSSGNPLEELDDWKNVNIKEKFISEKQTL